MTTITNEMIWNKMIEIENKINQLLPVQPITTSTPIPTRRPSTTPTRTRRPNVSSNNDKPKRNNMFNNFNSVHLPVLKNFKECARLYNTLTQQQKNLYKDKNYKVSIIQPPVIDHEPVVEPIIDEPIDEPIDVQPINTINFFDNIKPIQDDDDDEPIEFIDYSLPLQKLQNAVDTIHIEQLNFIEDKKTKVQSLVDSALKIIHNDDENDVENDDDNDEYNDDIDDDDYDDDNESDVENLFIMTEIEKHSGVFEILDRSRFINVDKFTQKIELVRIVHNEILMKGRRLFSKYCSFYPLQIEFNTRFRKSIASIKTIYKPNDVIIESYLIEYSTNAIIKHWEHFPNSICHQIANYICNCIGVRQTDFDRIWTYIYQKLGGTLRS